MNSHFSWGDTPWSPPAWDDAVAYELHIGTVSDEGTFQGLNRHLDALRDLGITHIELMPVCEFPGSRGWGDDGVSLFAPHHAYNALIWLGDYHADGPRLDAIDKVIDRGEWVEVRISTHPAAKTILSAGCPPDFPNAGAIRFKVPGIIIFDNIP